jgi:hypothetical protein
MSKGDARSVHLVGSVPLDSAEQVFSTVAAQLRGRIRRIPDGETGERLQWIGWQLEKLAATPGLEVGGERQLLGGKFKNPQLRLKAGAKPQDIKLPPPGYAAMAAASYATFKRLKSEGRIAPDVRFQVSLPTPLAVTFAFFVPDQVRALWPIYEAQLFAELDLIVRTIPHEELAIQWDVAVEIDQILEIPQVAKQYPLDELIASLARASMRVPEPVELGFHYCYGDPGHQHLIEPTDMALMVDLCNRMSRGISRSIQWIHMPVPKNRDDDAYFAPLANLWLPPPTELFLGLVHMTDGIDGARRRLRAASKQMRRFGIATECGFGRRPASTIPALLELHRRIGDLDV